MFRTACVLLIASAASSAQAQSNPGASAYQQRCSACHSVKPGETRIGPNLSGVAGRVAGTLPGYSYSTALKGAHIKWDKATLDRWLAGPGKLVPGTRMVIAVADPAERASIIAFLGTK